jgi:hypothetical protein
MDGGWLSVDDPGGAGAGGGVPFGQDRSSTGGSDCRDADATCLGDCGVDRACDAGSVRLLAEALVDRADDVPAAGD